MEFMKPGAFKDNARKAIADENLQSAMTMLNSSMIPNRQGAVDNLPEFNQLSQRGRELKDHILANLDFIWSVSNATAEPQEAGFTGARRQMRHGRRY